MRQVYASCKSRQIETWFNGRRQRWHSANSHEPLKCPSRNHSTDLFSTLDYRDFFRFFKQFLGCSHLISHSQNGIEIQVYCAIIACLLINLWTGRKPTKRTSEMLSYYFMGVASEEELLAHLAKLNRHSEAEASENDR